MSDPAAALSDAVTVEELRHAPRFRVATNVAAFFDALPVRLVNIGATGMQMEHECGIRLGTLGMFTIAAEEPVAMHARVVWSHLTAGERRAYRSGAAIEEDIGPIAGRLGRFVRAHASPETGSLERKRESQREREEQRLLASALPHDGTVSAILHARGVLSRFPVEAMTLYERGRQALAGTDVSTDLSGSAHKIEAFAIYELLDHRVPIGMIAAALARQR